VQPNHEGRAGPDLLGPQKVSEDKAMSDNWQQSQQRDLEILQEDAIKAILHARALGLSEEECMVIAYPAGLANDVYKELRK
jgi:hypothetical protein